MPIGSQLEKTLRRVVAVCSLGAGALALLALVGWVFGNWQIGLRALGGPSHYSSSCDGGPGPG